MRKPSKSIHVGKYYCEINPHCDGTGRATIYREGKVVGNDQYRYIIADFAHESHARLFMGALKEMKENKKMASSYDQCDRSGGLKCR